jgi:hypothetical protein
VDHKIALTEYLICIDSEDTKMKKTCALQCQDKMDMCNAFFPIGTAKTIRHLKWWIHIVQL